MTDETREPRTDPITWTLDLHRTEQQAGRPCRDVREHQLIDAAKAEARAAVGAAATPDAGVAGLDVERLARALATTTLNFGIEGTDWWTDAAPHIAKEYARLAAPSRELE